MTQSRQLAAIMFTDIKGFSRMMEENEHEANRVRERMIGSVKSQIANHQGRVVKFEGDGTLCVFNSSIEAVRAAIAIQLEMQTDPKVPLRIGIHSGDVLIEEKEVYGDGVNVASRVESFAIPGSVFISGKVNDEIKNQPDISTISLGQYEFKNIKEPVDLFAVSNPGIVIPSKNTIEGKGVAVAKKGIFSRKKTPYLVGTALFLAAAIFVYFNFFHNTASAMIKSVAVMPFQSVNDDPESEMFTDGITEDILTQISRVGDLNVISNSTMALFKNSKKSVQEIGKELNAGSVLVGSVRRVADKIRIFVQLVEATSGQSLWTDTYDREYSKIFEIQSEIAQIIANVLKAKLSPAEKARIKRKPTDNLLAYEHYLKGRSFYYHYKASENELAIAEFKKAIDFDPTYSLAWSGLGDAYSQKHARFGFDISWIDSSKQAGFKAIQLDSNSSEAYKALANAYNYAEDYDSGFVLLEKAVALNANNAPAVGNLGTAYFNKGQLDQAVLWEKKAAALNPKNAIPFMIIGWTYRLLNEQEKAEQWLKKSIELKPYFDAYRELAFSYLSGSKKDEAMNLIPPMIAIDSNNTRIFESAGLIALLAGNYSQARNYFQKSFELNKAITTDVNAFSTIGLGMFLLKENKKVDAEILLSRSLLLNLDYIRNQKSQDDDNRINIAAIYSIQGKKTEAMDWIQKAIDINWVDYSLVESSPWFESIHNEPRFKQMINTVKKEVEKMRLKSQQY